MSEQKEQSWCHCSLSGVEPTCGKPMVDDGTDFCENMLPDGTYCAHGHACHSLPDQAEPEPTNWQAHAEALAELLTIARCPDANCDNNGTTVHETVSTTIGCCGNHLPDGQCCGNGVPEAVQDIEPAPCQWCHMRAEALAAFDQAKGV